MPTVRNARGPAVADQAESFHISGSSARPEETTMYAEKIRAERQGGRRAGQGV